MAPKFDHNGAVHSNMSFRFVSDVNIKGQLTPILKLLSIRSPILVHTCAPVLVLKVLIIEGNDKHIIIKSGNDAEKIPS